MHTQYIKEEDKAASASVLFGANYNKGGTANYKENFPKLSVPDPPARKTLVYS